MTLTLVDRLASRRRDFGLGALSSSPRMARGVLIAIVALGALGGITVTSPTVADQAIAVAGPDLTRLLRFMALLKFAMGFGLIGATLWRLRDGIGTPRLLAYCAAGAAVAAGPGLIWTMAHAGWGALLLHGGLLANALLLWFDPAVVARFDTMIGMRKGRRSSARR